MLLDNAKFLALLAIFSAGPLVAAQSADFPHATATSPERSETSGCLTCESRSLTPPAKSKAVVRDPIFEQMRKARQSGDIATLRQLEAQRRATREAGGETVGSTNLSEPIGIGYPGEPESGSGGAEATFGSDVKVSSFLSANNIEQHPAMASDSAGNLYVVFENTLPSSGKQYVQVYSSGDNGATWTAYGYVSNTSADLTQPSIAVGEGSTGDVLLLAYIVDDGGTTIPHPEVATAPLGSSTFTAHSVPYWDFWESYASPVIWTDSADYGLWWAYLTGAGTFSGTNVNGVFFRSTDGGATWGDEQAVFGDTDTDAWLDTDGTYGTTYSRLILATYNDASNTLVSAVSDDFGLTFNTPVNIGTLTYEPSHAVDPDIEAAIGADNVMIVGTTSTGSVENIFQTYSTDAGDTWPNPLWNIEGSSSTTNEFAAALTANEGGGSWHLAWTGSDWWVRYSQRPQDLSGFWQSTPDIVNDIDWASASYPVKGIASHWSSDVPTVAWSDFRNYSSDGAYEIFADFDGNGGIPEPVIVISPETLSLTAGPESLGLAQTSPARLSFTRENLLAGSKQGMHATPAQKLIARSDAKPKEKPQALAVATGGTAQADDALITSILSPAQALPETLGIQLGKLPGDTRLHADVPPGQALAADSACNTGNKSPGQDVEFKTLTKVGEEVNESIRSSAERSDEYILTWPDASYIAVHFANFNLAPGDVVEISSPDGAHSHTYSGKGKVVRNGEAVLSNFWARSIPGDTAIVRLHTGSQSGDRKGNHGFEIDKWVHGYPSESSKQGASTEAICSADDKEWAPCYTGTDMYEKARAVARLLINGSGACTGWLIGSAGHLMTNQHCIGNQSDADNTEFEFMAEGATCGTDCSGWFDCPGTVEATSGTLVKVNSDLDYALVALPTNVTGTYGYLQLRDTLPSIDERIYIPQHPGGKGKQLGVLDTTDGPNCNVFSTNQTPCSGGPGDIGYYCDTEGGSSGSPVLGFNDNCVVALHHCANCPNRGVPIPDIIANLGVDLPAAALCNESPDSFVIYNTGTANLEVTSLSKRDGDAWLSWSPSAPFTIPPNGSQTVTVSIDWNLTVPGANDEQIIVASNDADKSPYPTGVFIDAQDDQGSCQAGPVNISNHTYTGEEVVRSDSTINVGSNVVVSGTGDVKLKAMTSVGFTGPFSVNAGGVLAVTTGIVCD